MSIPKRHHYVPEMILNGFTDSAGWLHWCEVKSQTLQVRRARPKGLFHQNHLYSTLSATGVKDPSMERDLSVLEGEAGAVVKAIIGGARAGEVPTLSARQKSIWYRFFLMQWRRTPETQQASTTDVVADKMLESILDELRTALPHRHSEIEKYAAQDTRSRILRNVRIQSLDRLSDEVLSVLECRGISVIRIVHPKKRFIVGSRPVVKLTMPGRTDLSDTAVEMWLPIASDIAVGVGRGDGNVSLFFANDAVPVRQLNEAIAAQSGIIAAASETLVRSIALASR